MLNTQQYLHTKNDCIDIVFHKLKYKNWMMMLGERFAFPRDYSRQLTTQISEIFRMQDDRIRTLSVVLGVTTSAFSTSTSFLVCHCVVTWRHRRRWAGDGASHPPLCDNLMHCCEYGLQCSIHMLQSFLLVHMVGERPSHEVSYYIRTCKLQWQ